jgi:hypothetical protein
VSYAGCRHPHSSFEISSRQCLASVSVRRRTSALTPVVAVWIAALAERRGAQRMKGAGISVNRAKADCI